MRTYALTRALITQGSTRHEIDFIVGDALLDKPLQFVQACVDIKDEKTRKRKLAALVAGMRHFDVQQGWIITMGDQEDIVVDDVGTIHVVPAWKWLFEV